MLLCLACYGTQLPNVAARGQKNTRSQKFSFDVQTAKGRSRSKIVASWVSLIMGRLGACWTDGLNSKRIN